MKLDLLEQKLGEVEVKADEASNKIEGIEGKGKLLAIEDETPIPDPVIENQPFLKALKAMSGRTLEGVPLFSGKMDPEVVMEWIEGLENHFECDGVTEAQKVKVAKSRLRGVALTWWKFIQDEHEKEGKRPISTWKGMLSKIREAYIPEDYEIQLHRRRQNLRQKELDVSIYTKEF